MSLRSFTVFQDTPASDILHHQATNDSPLLLSPSSNSVTQTAATSLAHLVSTAEKENVHPLTGERAGPSSNNSSKKRKTSVLVTKVHMPLGTKKQKESQEPKPETKKRKSSSSSAPKGKKDGKGSGSARKTAKKSSRKVSPMPKVDEVAGARKERERERITQADIDSRCYELTVQPLADVSRAYEQSPTFEEAHDPSDMEKVKFCPIKESSVEPEIRDYFSPSLSSSSSSGPATSKSNMETPPEASQEVKAFSTPERKQIYAAFTFTSPSPTSERFSTMTRSTSVPLLQIGGISPKPASE